MKILLLSPEVSPFAKTGGLADVSSALPYALNKIGHSCSIALPFYRMVKKGGFKPETVQSDVRLRLGKKEFSYNLLHLRHKNTDVYFIRNDELYDRDALYNTAQGEYPDNPVRFAFFDRAVLNSLGRIGMPDIIHCNDWQTALIPLYIKLFYGHDPAYKNLKTLFTIHNMAYQGVFDISFLRDIGLPEEYDDPEKLEFYGRLNLMKAGIIYSDAISTVSKGYAREILMRGFGCGLEGLLQTRRSSLYGIVNGADYGEWNPETDKFIAKNYNSKDLKGKAECKKDLLSHFGLRYDEKKPVLGVITRLAEQKGMDLVAGCMKDMLSLGAYFVLLGTGGKDYNDLFKRLSQKYKGKVGIKIDFDNPLAHKIEAGSDMFLMPSRYEPCGLNQMYSLKYATIPVVRATGGLDDTIEDFDASKKTGNGFKFKEASKEALLDTVKRAVGVYKDRKTWDALRKNALGCDFSWEASAAEYVKLYDSILRGNKGK